MRRAFIFLPVLGLILGACYHGGAAEDNPGKLPPAIVHAQSGPCADSLYVALRRVPVDSLSPREYELFRVRDEACVRFRTQAPAPVGTGEEPGRPVSRWRDALIFAGVVLATLLATR